MAPVRYFCLEAAVAFCAGAISAEVCGTLGGDLAVAAGECAPEVSSGFSAGGAYANGPGSLQAGGAEGTATPVGAETPGADAGADAAAAGVVTTFALAAAIGLAAVLRYIATTRS